MNPFRLIWSMIFGEFRSGKIWVSGAEQIKVHTCWTPSQVWLSFGPAGSHGGCSGEPDCFDVKIVPHGFIVCCSIKTHRRRLRWIAIG